MIYIAADLIRAQYFLLQSFGEWDRRPREGYGAQYASPGQVPKARERIRAAALRRDRAMTRALAFFAQLVLWAAVALIAATVFARSHAQPREITLLLSERWFGCVYEALSCKFSGNT